MGGDIDGLFRRPVFAGRINSSLVRCWRHCLKEKFAKFTRLYCLGDLAVRHGVAVPG